MLTYLFIPGDWLRSFCGFMSKKMADVKLSAYEDPVPTSC